MIENPYYSTEVHGSYEMFDLGDFVLEEGYTLWNCQLAYTTFGELNEARDNAILVTTWYSGTHQIFADACLYRAGVRIESGEVLYRGGQPDRYNKFFISTSHLVQRNLRSDSSIL